MRFVVDSPGALADWHPGLSVGNALLDGQHIELLELMRSLRDDIASAGDQSFCDRFSDILQLARRHCAAEEHQMAIHGSAGLEAHRAEHQAGLERLRFVRDLHFVGGITRESACIAAARWLERHLTETDLPAAGALRSLPGSAADDEAAGAFARADGN